MKQSEREEEADPRVDLDEARRFLAQLDPQATRWTFQTFDDDDAKRDSLARILHGTLDQHAARLTRLNDRGAGIFVTINETDGTGRKKDNIIRIRAVFADLDGAPLDLVYEFGRQPHVIVETSPGRWHAYWLVSNFPLERFEPAQKALIERFGSDPSVHDLPRVMRLPGFIHRKGVPFRSHIIESNLIAPYLRENFAQAVDNLFTAHSDAARLAGAEHTPGEPQADPERIAAAMRAIRNDDLGWEEWNRVGMALWRATDGSDDGLTLFHEFSGKSRKHDPWTTDAKWKEYRSSPPTRIGAGTLFYLADEARQRSFGEGWATDDARAPEAEPAIPEGRLILSSGEFVCDFRPPDYLIDGVVQRQFLYSMTGMTGHGKTCVVVRIAIHAALGLPLAGHEIDKGKVLFFAGENPDDIRMRWIKLCEEMEQDPTPWRCTLCRARQ